MGFELQVGIRYLKSRRKNPFISLVTVVSVLGVMVGVMAMVVVISVMNGFRADLMSKILGVNPHLVVMSRAGAMADYASLRESCELVDGVLATAPFVKSQVMVNRGGRAAGAVMKGIKPGTTSMVIPLRDVMKEGTVDNLEATDDPKQVSSAVVGSELARMLGLSVGSRFTAVSPEGRLTPLGRVPNSRSFVVSGIFESGMYQHDVSIFFVSLSEAQDFLGTGERVSGVDARVENPGLADAVGRRVAGRIGEAFIVRDWMTENKSLFAALQLEKVTMFVILTMMILVGALNIVSTLVMVVMEKTGDLTILRVMGAGKASVMGIFVVQGVFIGLVGVVLGIAAGLGLCHILATGDFISLPADFFHLGYLPVKVEALDIWLVAGAALFLSFLATIYPSWRASRLNPAEAIRYG